MCASCGFPAAPGHWTEAGAASAPDRLRARFRRAEVLKSVLPAYGLTAHDGAQVPGIQLSTLSGNHALVRDLEEVWATAEQLCRRRRSIRSIRASSAAGIRLTVSDRADGRMRLTVLGGFLGSGKTTWLRHQLHEGALSGRLRRRQRGGGNAGGRRPADALVAHRGAGRRLRLLHGRVLTCSRCSGRSATSAAAQLPARSGCNASCSKPAASPIPAPIVEAIRADPVLVHHIVVSEIIVAVDALHALAQLRGEPLGRRQVEIADRLIVTKIDEAEEGALARLAGDARARSIPVPRSPARSRDREAALPPSRRRRAGSLARSFRRCRAAGDLPDQAGDRRSDRLDSVQRLALGAAACARR